MPRTPILSCVAALLLAAALVPNAHARSARRARTAPAAVTSPAPAAAEPVAAPLAVTPLALPTLLPAEQAMISRSQQGLVPVRLANGALRLDLLGRFQEFAAISNGPNGTRQFWCVDDADALRRILAGTVVAPVTTPSPAAEDR
jgi:hypothetical protein